MSESPKDTAKAFNSRHAGRWGALVTKTGFDIMHKCDYGWDFHCHVKTLDEFESGLANVRSSLSLDAP